MINIYIFGKEKLIRKSYPSNDRKFLSVHEEVSLIGSQRGAGDL